MTAKRKAQDLFVKFGGVIKAEEKFTHDEDSMSNTISFDKNKAKECVLILIDEILEEKKMFEPYGSRIEWWEDTKTEIEKL